MLLDVSIETSRRSLETSRPSTIAADISHAGHCKVLVRTPLVTIAMFAMFVVIVVSTVASASKKASAARAPFV
jgi:hypothetical protein